jgi:hypothetical protein
MVGLGDLPGGGFFSQANGVSADGSTIVGYSSAFDLPLNNRAFRWTAETGLIALPDVPGIGPTANAEAVSADGSIVVGGAYPRFGSSNGAFAWDTFHGSRSISDLLVDQGVDLAGWELGTARGVSDDGLTVAGLGLNPDGLQQPWAARLDPGEFHSRTIVDRIWRGVPGFVVIMLVHSSALCALSRQPDERPTRNRWRSVDPFATLRLCVSFSSRESHAKPPSRKGQRGGRGGFNSRLTQVPGLPCLRVGLPLAYVSRCCG